MKISIFTSMTNPKERMDPWKESLSCYEDFSDELVIVGEDWDYEFNWVKIGNVFQDGFDKCSRDWVIRMDLDYFFHENDLNTLRKSLNKYKGSPAITFKIYNFILDIIKIFNQITWDKRLYPNIKLNGGGDLMQFYINFIFYINI